MSGVGAGSTLGARLALLVVTDAACGEGRALVEVVRAALVGGAPAIQLRAKVEPTRDTVALAERLLVETRRAGALLFVNDRVDVALAVGADGAHIGDDDLPLPAARRIVPEGFLLGRSVETPAQAATAVREGADYIGVGPVFATLSKADAGPAIGTEGVRAVCAAAGGVPVVGIGGIDSSNARAVAAAGAAGVAVIRAVMLAPDPAAASESLLAAVRGEAPVRG
jgi:thiamine-phosphate pyrophosphorylase